MVYHVTVLRNTELCQSAVSDSFCCTQNMNPVLKHLRYATNSEGYASRFRDPKGKLWNIFVRVDRSSSVTDSLRSPAMLLVYVWPCARGTSNSTDHWFIEFVKTVESKNDFNVNVRVSESPKFDESENIYKSGIVFPSVNVVSLKH